MIVRTGYVETAQGEQLEVLIIRNAKKVLPIRIVVIQKGGVSATLFEGRPFAGYIIWRLIRDVARNAGLD